MKNSYILCIVALLYSCDGYVPPDTIFGPRWDLSKPINVSISPTMPKPSMVLLSIQNAVRAAGGVPSSDTSDYQKWHVLDTDGDKCDTVIGAAAYTQLPSNGNSFICHSALLLSSYSQADIDQITAHEFGHELANRADHIGGEPHTPPASNCTSHAVMSNNTVCHASKSVAYTGDDIEYICSGHNTINGICNTPIY